VATLAVGHAAAFAVNLAPVASQWQHHDLKATHRKRNMDNDDLWDTQMPLKMNKQFMNLRHGLFANFNGKHFVVGAGRS